MSNIQFWSLNGRTIFWARVTGCLLAICFATNVVADDATNSPGTTEKAEAAGSQDTLRAYLQLQEQLHETQLALERNRQDAEAAAARSSEVIAERLKVIEQTLSSQRTSELEAMQSSNRLMLIIAGTFAAFGFLAMLLVAYFQWRAAHRFAEAIAALPMSHALGTAHAAMALAAGETHLATVGSAERSNALLLGAIERLEKRIHELEHTNQPHQPLTENGSPNNESNASAADSAAESPTVQTGRPEISDEASRITVLLSKGQSLLNLDQAENAVACFDEVLAFDPANTEALIKKGVALERLQKLNEAVACYDRVIETDSSITIAYLHKGGVFNRMERYNEALECYEQALRTQEKSQSLASP